MRIRNAATRMLAGAAEIAPPGENLAGDTPQPRRQQSERLLHRMILPPSGV